MKKGIGKENHVKNKGSFEKKITLVTSHCPKTNRKERNDTAKNNTSNTASKKLSKKRVCVTIGKGQIQTSPHPIPTFKRCCLKSCCPLCPHQGMLFKCLFL